MHIIHNLHIALTRKLTIKPAYNAFIYLRDHDNKVNPKQSRLNLSYMDPKLQTNVKVKHEPFSAKLRRGAHQHLQKKLFQQYKTKILQGKVDQEEVIEPDTLWGDSQKPVHFYKNLSNKQISTLSHSIRKDVEHMQNAIIQQRFLNNIKIQKIEDAKQLNDFAELACFYRLNRIEQSEKYYQIQQKIGNKFHLLTNRSLILLKYAFMTVPKKGHPQFNKILSNLLLQSINELNLNELICLMYFNRYDHFKLGKNNLQKPLIQKISNHFNKMSVEQKIDFLFLFVDSRNPTIIRRSHDRYANQIRNNFQQILFHLNLNEQFSNISEKHILKLAYSLVRAKTNMTDHITMKICKYLNENIDRLSAEYVPLFFIYLAQAQSNKSISDINLMKSLKQKIISSWSNLSSINKIRCIDAMYTLNLYDQNVNKLYTQIQIEADSTMLAHCCRLEMMNSSGRQWQVIHKTAQLDCIPFVYYQDFKRFYNYVSSIAPDWNLDSIGEKIQNSQIFYDSSRQQSMSMDKNYFRQIRQFQQFSKLKCLPNKFKMGHPINNVQYAQFQLPHYQISIDVITDVERVRGTQQVKGSYLRKIKSLESIGWKHLYVFQQQVQNLAPLQLFNFLYSVCQPHFSEQLKIIASYEQYRSFEVDENITTFQKTMLKMKQYQRYMATQDFDLVGQQRETNTLDQAQMQQKQQEQKKDNKQENKNENKSEGKNENKKEGKKQNKNDKAKA